MSKIGIGTRGTLKKFKQSYQRDFLEKHGEIIVHDDDVLTYVGSKKWAVEQRKD